MYFILPLFIYSFIAVLPYPLQLFITIVITFHFICPHPHPDCPGWPHGLPTRPRDCPAAAFADLTIAPHGRPPPHLCCPTHPVFCHTTPMPRCPTTPPLPCWFGTDDDIQALPLCMTLPYDRVVCGGIMWSVWMTMTVLITQDGAPVDGIRQFLASDIIIINQWCAIMRMTIVLYSPSVSSTMTCCYYYCLLCVCVVDHIAPISPLPLPLPRCICPPAPPLPHVPLLYCICPITHCTLHAPPWHIYPIILLLLWWYLPIYCITLPIVWRMCAITHLCVCCPAFLVLCIYCNVCVIKYYYCIIPIVLYCRTVCGRTDSPDDGLCRDLAAAPRIPGLYPLYCAPLPRALYPRPLCPDHIVPRTPAGVWPVALWDHMTGTTTFAHPTRCPRWPPLPRLCADFAPLLWWWYCCYCFIWHLIRLLYYPDPHDVIYYYRWYFTFVVTILLHLRHFTFALYLLPHYLWQYFIIIYYLLFFPRKWQWHIVIILFPHYFAMTILPHYFPIVDYSQPWYYCASENLLFCWWHLMTFYYTLGPQRWYFATCDRFYPSILLFVGTLYLFPIVIWYWYLIYCPLCICIYYSFILLFYLTYLFICIIYCGRIVVLLLLLLLY